MFGLTIEEENKLFFVSTVATKRFFEIYFDRDSLSNRKWLLEIFHIYSFSESENTFISYIIPFESKEQVEQAVFLSRMIG